MIAGWTVLLTDKCKHWKEGNLSFGVEGVEQDREATEQYCTAIFICAKFKDYQKTQERVKKDRWDIHSEGPFNKKFVYYLKHDVVLIINCIFVTFLLN